MRRGSRPSSPTRLRPASSSSSQQSSPRSPRSPRTKNDDHVKVVVRVRPPLGREVQSGQYTQCVQSDSNSHMITIAEEFDQDGNPTYGCQQFSFDAVFGQDSTQVEVYDETAKDAVMSALEVG